MKNYQMIEMNKLEKILIITSAAYVSSELQAEFGYIPPSFLPLGNKRLFKHQIEKFSASTSRIILSLPMDFEVNAEDLDFLLKNKIEIVNVPNNLSLGNSLVYVINICAISGKPVSILHGDTLLYGLDLISTDVISTDSLAPSDYQWGHVRVNNSGTVDFPKSENNAILTGYFCLNNASMFVQALTLAEGSFIEGLSRYALSYPLKKISSETWYDFGHIGTYHRSRQAITTERSFNLLHADKRVVTKSSSNDLKIEAEALWFKNLPERLRIYTPQFLGLEKKNSYSYSIEYLYLPTLTDLYVFGKLSPSAWAKIFSSCDELLTELVKFKSLKKDAHAAKEIYLTKTINRLEEFSRATGISLDKDCVYSGTKLPSLRRIVELTSEVLIENEETKESLIHGDFCFNNIFYDVKSNLIKVIDPRGLNFKNSFTSYGDERYDIGKLHHSVVGFYDHIVCGYFKLKKNGDLNYSIELPNNEYYKKIINVFNQSVFAGKTASESNAELISVLLFLSMLPLHSDDSNRQNAFLANALRLFYEYGNKI
jgi:hypothetical protein